MGKGLDPKIAEKIMLAAGLKPLEPYSKAHIKWKCLHLECGEIVFTRLSTIKKSDGTFRSGCIKCSNNKRKTPETIAISIMKKAGFKTLEPFNNSSSPWKSLCLKCGSTVNPSLTRVKMNKGCKECSRIKSLVSQKKIIEVMKKRKLKPLEPYVNNKAKWKCKCLRCGKIVYPSYSSISNPKKNSTGCFNCGMRQAAKSNTTPSEKAVAVMLKSKLKPLEPYKNSGSQWKCKCLICNKILLTSYTSVAYHKTGCRYCNNAKKEIKNRRKDAVTIANKANLKPLEPYKSVHTPWRCRCLVCNKIVTPALNQLAKGQGCKYCAPRGINLNVRSYLYLITNDELEAHKIGIGNERQTFNKSFDRLGKFTKKGWKVYRIWNFETGDLAWKIEQKALREVRQELKIPIFLSVEQMGKRLGGQTETVSAESITLLDLEKIIKKVIKTVGKD